MEFHPVQEHRSWCPWINDRTLTPSEDISQSDESTKSTEIDNTAGWKRLMYVLLPEANPNRSISQQAKNVSNQMSLIQVKGML